MNKKQNKAITCSIIFIVGFLLISYNYVQSKKILAYDYMSKKYFSNNKIKEIKREEKKEEVESVSDKTVENEVSNEFNDEYIGYLTIPKINLTKGFVDYRSQENDVEKNIQVIAGSNYPDVDKGNFIIAGHSGTGWKAFFNELYQLTTNDTIYITYKNKKYIYKITNIYKQPKTGTISIYRNYNKTTLTLVTCTNDDSTSQTVYISELVSIEE